MIAGWLLSQKAAQARPNCRVVRRSTLAALLGRLGPGRPCRNDQCKADTRAYFGFRLKASFRTCVMQNCALQHKPDSVKWTASAIYSSQIDADPSDPHPPPADRFRSSPPHLLPRRAFLIDLRHDSSGFLIARIAWTRNSCRCHRPPLTELPTIQTSDGSEMIGLVFTG
jgi:hypothetical protein